MSATTADRQLPFDTSDDTPAGGGTSLALYGELSHPPTEGHSEPIPAPPEPAPERCPRKLDWHMLNETTGEVIPASCGAQFCAYCGPRHAYKVGLAIALAQPQRHGRVSLVGDTWELVQARMNRLRYDLRSDGTKVEWIWMVEANPRGTGHHAHFWQHGDFIPQDRLQRLCERRGMGIPWIGAWKARKPQSGDPDALQTVIYGMKGAAYGLKATATTSGLAEHLRLNGGRLEHHSRGFFREGDQQLSKADAIKRATELVHAEDGPDHWVLKRGRCELPASQASGTVSA